MATPAVTFTEKPYHDLDDEVCPHGAYKRCCKPCWNREQGPWELRRESTKIEQEKLPLDVKRLWHGTRCKDAGLMWWNITKPVVRKLEPIPDRSLSALKSRGRP